MVYLDVVAYGSLEAVEEAASHTFQAVFQLITLYPVLAFYTKRLHDRNRSGWFLLILLIPLIGAIWLIIELGFLRGTKGPNKYGADPAAI